MLTPSLSSRSVPFHPKSSHRPLICSFTGGGERRVTQFFPCFLVIKYANCRSLFISTKKKAQVVPWTFTSISSSDDQQKFFVFTVHWLVIGRCAQHPISFQKTPLFSVSTALAQWHFLKNYFFTVAIFRWNQFSWNFIFFLKQKKIQWSTN